MKKHLASSLVWLCLLSVMLSVSAFAQEFRATVNGRVTDQNKAAVPNAAIAVRNLATNETVTVTSNAEGNYTVPFLKPGIYTIAVEASGFKKFLRDKQELQVSQTATIDVARRIESKSIRAVRDSADNAVAAGCAVGDQPACPACAVTEGISTSITNRR